VSFSGKVVLVTGAASGIGRALAWGFAAQKASVVIADLDHRSCDDTASEIAETTGSEVIGITMNVAEEWSVERGFEAALKRFGRIDVLISNAGVQIISGVDQLSFSDWRKVLGVHLDGAFLTTRACLRHMYASGNGGSIIYMGSVHSKTASPLKAPYIAAKHGLIGLCRAIAKEGARHGVRANVICPGFVRTPLVEKQIPEQARLLNLSESDVVRHVMLKDTVDGEFTTVEEITQAALFLASRDSLAITGQSLLVSHGWMME
jgi:3-hydroxybutyrate dehydrogenase